MLCAIVCWTWPGLQFENWAFPWLTTALHLVGAFPYKCRSNDQFHYCCVWDNPCFLKRDNQYGIFPMFSLHNSTIWWTMNAISWENPCLAPVSVQSHLQCTRMLDLPRFSPNSNQKGSKSKFRVILVCFFPKKRQKNKYSGRQTIRISGKQSGSPHLTNF